MPTLPSVSEYDMTVSVWLDSTTDPLILLAFRQAARTLRADGFTIHADQMHDAHYPCLKGTQKRGRKGALEVVIGHTGRVVEVKFFQNVVKDNRHGGEFDFDKSQKAPYLVKLAYIKARNRLDTAWQALGLPPMKMDERSTIRGLAFIQKKEQELNAFQRWTSKPVPDPRNATSSANRLITEGDRVLFSHRGRWMQGTAYHNINNMWWVLCAGEEVHNLACFDLIHRGDLQQALKGRQIPIRQAIAQVSRKLAKQVANEAFERAIPLRRRRDQLTNQLIAA